MTSDMILQARARYEREITELIGEALEARPAAEAPEQEWARHLRTLEALERDALDRIEAMLTELAVRLGQRRGIGASPQPNAIALRENWMMRAETLESRLMILWNGYEELDAIRRHLAARCDEGDAGGPHVRGEAAG